MVRQAKPPVPSSLLDVWGAAASKKIWKEMLDRHGESSSPVHLEIYEQLCGMKLTMMHLQKDVKKRGVTVKYHGNDVENKAIGHIEKLNKEIRQVVVMLSDLKPTEKPARGVASRKKKR